MTANFCLDIFG